MGRKTSPRGRSILAGSVLVGVQLWLIHLNGRLEEGMLRLRVPALLPDLYLQSFACVVAFLMGWAFFKLPSPRGSDKVVALASLRSLLVGVVSAAIVFQLLHLISRRPENESMSVSLRPWTKIVPLALWTSVLPTWLSFFAFARGGFEEKARPPTKSS